MKTLKRLLPILSIAFYLLLIHSTVFSSNLDSKNEQSIEAPLIPETCTIQVNMKWIDNPTYIWTTIVYVRDNNVTANPPGGTFKGTLHENIIRGEGCLGTSNWSKETLTFYPDGTAGLDGDYYGRQKDGTINHSHGIGRGTWRITSQPPPQTQTPAEETPVSTIGEDQELKSIGQVEGNERWVAISAESADNNKELQSWQRHIQWLVDELSKYKEVYREEQARLKELQDEDRNLRISIPSWESEEKNINVQSISEKLKTQHDQIKEIDQQFDNDVQQSIVGQKAPDLNQTEAISKFGFSEKQKSDIEKKTDAAQSAGQKVESEAKSSIKDIKEGASQFVELQNVHDTNKAYAQNQILELNDQLKRHKELNRKIEEGNARLLELKAAMESTKGKMNSYAALYQKTREDARLAYEKYKSIEKKSAK